MPTFGSHLLRYEDLQLGRQIRKARQRRGLTLQQLAGKSDVSVTRLSQSENEHHVPDLEQLGAIAQALDTSVEAFLPSDREIPYQIRRHGETGAEAPRQVIRVPTSDDPHKTYEHRFWPLAELFVGRQMEPLLARIMPVEIERLCCHHDYEFMFVLTGRVELVVKTRAGIQREELQRGDCVYLRSSLPHAQRSLESEPAETLHVLSSAAPPPITAWTWLSPHAAVYEVDGKRNSRATLGRELRLHRQSRSWEVKELADLVGVRARYLHQVERGERAVALDVLMKLARVFGMPLQEFVRRTGTSTSHVVQRAADIGNIRPRKRRLPSGFPTHGIPRYVPLTSGLGEDNMYPCLVELPNDEAAAPTLLHEHHGQEFIYVLDGSVELIAHAEGGEKREVLESGDSCYLECSVPHLIRSLSRNPYAATSAQVLDVFWCPLGEGYLFAD